MKTYTYATVTDVPAQVLFDAITNIRAWPEWDHDIEATSHDGDLRRGARFGLKPRGGPKVAMEIVEATAPTTFIDLSHLAFAKMRTGHRFTPLPDGGTRVDVTIEVFGPLAFLWGRIVARKQAIGAAKQTSAFIDYTKSSDLK